MQREYFDSVNGFSVALDGECFDFRPVRQDDRKIVQDGMSALSSRSRYLRFFSLISQLSDEQLHYFTAVDQHDHVAWIALTRAQTEHPGVGIARFIRLPNQAEIAEFAVTVIDSHQHRGIGSLLMAVLYRMAYLKGVQILRGFVLPENRLMAAWLTRLGAVSHYENDVCRMDIRVHGETPDLSAPRLLTLLRDYADRMTPISRQIPDQPEKTD
ncbi:N-acetyltransferase family protein [Methylomonas sp. MgM2]